LLSVSCHQVVGLRPRLRASYFSAIPTMRVTFCSAGFALALAEGPTRLQKGSKAAPPDTYDLAAAAGPGPNGLAKTPPMGWMSWEIFRCQTDCAHYPDSCIDHNLYEQTTDAIVDGGYLGLGYNQVSIDDCWEDINGRDSSGRLVPDASRFPSGMKALGDYMHAKGVKFGTYSDEGTKTCGGYPGTKGYEEVDAQTFAEWGVDYLKLDGCYNDQQSYVTGYPAAGAALQATGRDIVYSCSWPAYLGSDETSKPFQAMVDSGCNLWRNWDDIQCSWGSLSSIIDHWGKYASSLQATAGPGHWHDMDMLLIGNGCISTDEEKTQMAIWSISASPLIMGNDLRSVPDVSKAILQNTDAIAVSQDSLGKMGGRITGDVNQQVWARELSEGKVAVALYNKGGGAQPLPPIPTGSCDAWNKTGNGYLEACGGADGNVGTFSGLTVEQAQDACCNNAKCAGFDFNRASGSGYYKGDQNCGMTQNAAYDGYTKPSQYPSEDAKTADVTVNFSDVGLSGEVAVYDIWAQQQVGIFQGSYTASSVAYHGSAFLRLSSHDATVVV